MLKVRDEEINRILCKAEKIREQYEVNKKIKVEDNIKFDIDEEAGTIFEEFENIIKMLGIIKRNGKNIKKKKEKK